MPIVDLYAMLTEKGTGQIPNTTILAGSLTRTNRPVWVGIAATLMNTVQHASVDRKVFGATTVLVDGPLTLGFDSDSGDLKMNHMDAVKLLPHLAITSWSVTRLPPATTFTIAVLENDFQYDAFYDWVTSHADSLEYAEVDDGISLNSFMSFDAFNIAKGHVWGMVSPEYDEWLATLPPERQEILSQQAAVTAREAQLNIARYAKKAAAVEPTDLIMELVRWFQTKLAAYLCGDSGTGKTTVFMKVASILGIPFYLQVFDKYMDPDRILGTYIPNGDGSLRFEYSPFMKAFKFGGMFLADEVNMTSGDITSLFHSVLDGQDIIVVHQTGEVVERHPLFRMGGAVNEGYAGTKPTNKAFLSRFGRRDRVETMSEDMLVNLAKKEFVDALGRPDGIEEGVIRKMSKVIKKIEEKYRKEEIDGVVNYRHLQGWISLYLLNRDLKESARSTVVNLSCESREVNDQVMANIIPQVLV
jgi:MoxR-like ATPase